MKKNGNKIAAFFIILTVIVSVAGCGRYHVHNQKPDDAISKAIEEAAGEKAAYTKRDATSDGEQIYYYVIQDYEDEKLLDHIAAAVNEALKSDPGEKETQRIQICIAEVIPGGTETVAILYNYWEEGQECEVFSEISGLSIYGTVNSLKGEDSRYNEIATYTSLKKIRHLEIGEKIAKAAEEEAVDWYQLWPELETVIHP